MYKNQDNSLTCIKIDEDGLYDFDWFWWLFIYFQLILINCEWCWLVLIDFHLLLSMLLYCCLLLLIFIVLLSPIMRQVPLCAFAILLVYTGFKLAAPAVFKQVYNQGTEQLIFFVATMVLTLYTNLLIGSSLKYHEIALCFHDVLYMS